MKYFSLLMGVLVYVSLSVSPAAAVELTIKGNGADANSVIKAIQSQATIVSQSNATTITNVVSVKADTGNNKIDGSTGGENIIDTGKATTKVKVTNKASSNLAVVDACGCGDDALIVDIKNNGKGTDNKVKVADLEVTAVVQTNQTAITNVIEAEAETGDNDIKGTTGGDTEITTGNAKAVIHVDNLAGANTGVIGSEAEPGEGGTNLDFYIGKNGADSTNTIDATVGSGQILTQANQTGITNGTDGQAGTGDNDIKGTTGGGNIINTGDATLKIGIDNQAGFNQGALDCGCVSLALEAEIKHNGKDTDNTIRAKLEANQVVSQKNTCGTAKKQSLFSLFNSKKSLGSDCFTNLVGGESTTGDNHLKGSTGTSGSDPAIFTGMSDVIVKIQNKGGSNHYGPSFIYW